MNDIGETASPKLHEQPEIFIASVNFTARSSGFSERLVEKDYFCTLLLIFLNQHSNGELIFKGGTSLSKVLFEFYRLSEDLDFIIPMPVTATKGDRSKRVLNLKNAISAISKSMPVFYVEKELTGANSSRQYLATIGYQSFIFDRPETIKIEIGLREPLLQKPLLGDVKTMLLNAANSRPAAPPFSLNCLSLKEAMAEKFRAALSRPEVAIRDFYDIDYAESRKEIGVDEPSFIEMIRKKLEIPGNDPPDTSQERLRLLRAQVDTDLKPVLRAKDLDSFNLERAIDLVRAIHSRLN